MDKNNNYIGYTLDEVKCYFDLNYRIVKIDGNACVVTCDYVPHRHNFTIENGIIVNDYLG